MARSADQIAAVAIQEEIVGVTASGECLDDVARIDVPALKRGRQSIGKDHFATGWIDGQGKVQTMHSRRP